MGEGEMIAALVAGISALYATLHLEMRRRADDLRAIYEQEREERREILSLVLEGIREVNLAVNEVERTLEAISRHHTS